MTTGQEKKKLTRKGGSEAPEQKQCLQELYLHIKCIAVHCYLI